MHLCITKDPLNRRSQCQPVPDHAVPETRFHCLVVVNGIKTFMAGGEGAPDAAYMNDRTIVAKYAFYTYILYHI